MPYSAQDARRRLEQNWIAYARQKMKKLDAGKVIDGSCPPSIFVGRHGYPKVSVGPMIPLEHGDTSVLERSELWAGRTIQEIASYRISLIRGTSRVGVKDISGKYVGTLQELALSREPVESEATLEKPLNPDLLAFQPELSLSENAPPFGPAAQINALVMTGSSSSDPRIEYAYYDTDLKASEALLALYRKGVPISSIHRVLSIGMLGLDKTRKLVPTRWSITATDDVISKQLVSEMVDFASIDNCYVAKYAHMGNQYAVILIPDDVWRFEMIEAWHTDSGRVAMGADFEDHDGLDHYPTIAGAYFAARLAVAEYLHRIRRKCACLVLREIRPEYTIPLGVWQIREGVRSAMSSDLSEFDVLEDAIAFAFTSLSISPRELLGKSRLYDEVKHQKRITDFA